MQACRRVSTRGARLYARSFAVTYWSCRNGVVILPQQAFIAQKRRRAWSVWTEWSAKLRNGGVQRWRVKGRCVLVAVCINAQSGEQTVRPAETQFAGKSSKSRGWDVRTEMECRPVSPFVVHLASSFPAVRPLPFLLAALPPILVPHIQRSTEMLTTTV